MSKTAVDRFNVVGAGGTQADDDSWMDEEEDLSDENAMNMLRDARLRELRAAKAEMERRREEGLGTYSEVELMDLVRPKTQDDETLYSQCCVVCHVRDSFLTNINQ